MLETMVALVIFAASAMALADLLNTNLSTLGRVREVSQQIPAVKNIIAHIGAMNLHSEGDGQFEMNGYSVYWQAQLLEPYRESQVRTGYQGNHRVGLYQIEFRLEQGGRLVGEYSLRQVGQKTIRAPEL